MSDTPKKRGRPRKPDDQLKRPRAKKAEEAVEVELEVAQIEVGDTRGALALLDEAERAEIERESRRFSLAAEIAKHRWTIAKNYHRIEDGQPLSFDDRPFLIDIYKDPSPDLLIHGSAQFGKTEWMICDLAASAGIAGLKVLFITSKQEKRNKFVSGRIDPCFNSVPMYKQLFQAAQNRAATADSTGLKHFGAGSINFLFANASAKGEFTSWPADKYMVDEHQECDSGSLLKLPDRLSGSKYKFVVNVGHPSYPGSHTLQNLDFMYQHSDQRRWYIRCQNCGTESEVNWWEHVVEEVRSESGAILSVEPRDKDFISDANGIDLKPICSMCRRPMNRLTRDAYWKQLNPGAARHGYRLSNLCNVNERLSDLYTRYLNARHLPEAMFEFYTKQLGICYTMSGTQINEKMLRDCTTGDYTGIRPYSFVPVSSFNWRGHRGAA